MYNKPARLTVLILFAAALLPLAACESAETEAKYPTGHERHEATDDIYAERDTIWGEGGLFKALSRKDGGEEGGNIGVNTFLWRASLDTVSFMPLASADPFGGVILTDWYSAPESENERFKLNVFILGRELRSDGVRVRVFRQVKSGGTWKDAAVTDSTARQLEDTILTRARQLRVAQVGAAED